MKKTQEEYEKSINASSVFDIDPVKDTILYKTERAKLLTNIAEYYKHYIYRKKEQDDYGFVLIETADECIRYYNKTKGPFINLLNYNMKRKYAIARAIERQEETRKGISIGGATEQQIRMIVKYAKIRGWDLSKSEVRERIAAALKFSPEKVDRLLTVNQQATAVSDTVCDQDGQEVSVFDLIPSGDPTAEDIEEQKENFSAVLENIETAYLSLPEQTKTKHLVSMVLTAKVIREFSDDLEIVFPLIRSKSFYNEEVALHFMKQGAVLSMKQIADQLGLSLPDASQRMKRFFSKISQ